MHIETNTLAKYYSSALLTLVQLNAIELQVPKKLVITIFQSANGDVVQRLSLEKDFKPVQVRNLSSQRQLKNILEL